MVYAKTVEPIEMPFAGLTRMGDCAPKKPHIRRGQGGRNTFAAAMRLSSKFSDHLFNEHVSQHLNASFQSLVN